MPLKPAAAALCASALSGSACAAAPVATRPALDLRNVRRDVASPANGSDMTISPLASHRMRVERFARKHCRHSGADRKRGKGLGRVAADSNGGRRCSQAYPDHQEDAGHAGRRRDQTRQKRNGELPDTIAHPPQRIGSSARFVSG